MTSRSARPLHPAARRALSGGYLVAAVAGCLTFALRGHQDGDDFFYLLAAVNGAFWIGLLVLVRAVDNRRIAERDASETGEDSPTS